MEYMRSEEYKVSWPRTDREERRYSIKRSRAAAEALFTLLDKRGTVDIQFHTRQLQVGEWKEESATQALRSDRHIDKDLTR